jgi:uncharacterized protein
MRIERSSHVETFLGRAGGFLAVREAEHNLIFGICSNLAKGFTYGEDPPYLACAEDEGEIVAAAIRTPPFGVVLSMVDDPAALDLFARDLRAVYEDLPGVLGPREAARSFVSIWQEISGRSARLSIQERIHRCEEVSPAPQVSGRMRRADLDDEDLLLDWSKSFLAEALPEEAPERHFGDRPEFIMRRLSDPDGGLYFWDDGEPVSLAGCGGPTPNGIRIGPVYTPPPFRRRGYATALVGELTQKLLQGGQRFCFLFTDLANPTSNSVYQKVGYRPVMDVDQYFFD